MIDPRGLPMPNAVDAEQQVLGALLLRNEAFATIAAHVSARDFGEPLHARIFDVASSLIAAGKPATLATIKPFVGDDEVDQGVTVGGYLAMLCSNAMPQAMAPGAAQVVRAMAARRRLIAVAESLNERARDVSVRVDASSLVGDAIRDLQTIAASTSTATTRHVSHFADEAIATIDQVRSGALVHQVVTTGYPDLDAAMNGYRAGTLVIVAGRPGMGKSMLMNSSARRCAERAGVGVLEFPLEIGAEDLTARHLADLAFAGDDDVVAFRDVGSRGGGLSDRQVDRLRAARQRLSGLPIDIDGRSRVTVADIAAKVAQVKAARAAQGTTLGVVFVDHLDFIAATDRYSGNRVQEIGEICIGLKNIARTEGLCLVLLCQLSRALEGRAETNRRPGLADLRNSGDLEQVADVVMLLYRPEYYLAKSADARAGDAEALDRAEEARGKFDVILGKVRAGPTRTVHLWCSPAASSVSSFVRGRV